MVLKLRHAKLTKNEVVGPEYLSEGSRADRVHSPRLQVNQNCPRNVLASGSLVVVDIYPLQLKVGVSMVGTGRVDAVLV